MVTGEVRTRISGFQSERVIHYTTEALMISEITADVFVFFGLGKLLRGCMAHDI